MGGFFVRPCFWAKTMTKALFDTLALILIVILGLLLVVEKEVRRVGTVPAPAQRENEQR